ncbi:hypothetical protein IM876_09470 [Serratia plymuthica]|uniref:GDSL-type esterase/lipase family protein n=1 Tax=Serratia plymuthica TaxID=82996 RepID=UPI0019274132|nr:GDSL-type esterase/lipase family protein [Serratia plymuthica]MBL3522892.1 hypothetical protein [Serratia plymuthica]
MALTDSQSSKQSASIAENAAAEAKSYADLASKSEDFSNQAEQSALEASESADASEASKILSEGFANSAQISAESASAYATQAEGYGDNKYTFPDTAAGLAGVISGQYFRVPQGVDNDASFIYYLNDSGVAVAVSSEVGKAAIERAIAIATATDNRTTGVNTAVSQSANVGEWLKVDPNGRVSIKIDSAGKKYLYGDTDADTIFVKQIIDFSSSNLSPSYGNLYLSANMDDKGRVLYGVRKADNKLEYMGVPLTNIRGMLPNDIFYIGDSITAYGQAWSGANNTGTSYAPLLNAQSWPAWGEIFSNGRIIYAGQSATGGFTTSQILTTHLPVAIAKGNTFCVVLGGRNDVNGAVALSTTIQNFTAIFSKLRYAGIIPVVCTMPAQSGNTDSKKLNENQINEFLKAYALKYGLPFVDFHAATVDPLTGEWKSGYNQDVSHPTPLGASVMGKALSDAMIQWVAPTLPRTAVSLTTPGLSNNLIDNPLFGASTSGVPTGWTTSTAGTVTVATDSQILGNAWTITGSSTVPKYTKTISVTAGTKIGFGAMLKCTANDSSSVAFYAVAGDSTSTVYLAGIRGWKLTITNFGYFYYEATIPTGVTQLTIIASVNLGTLNIAQLGAFVLDTTDY